MKSVRFVCLFVVLISMLVLAQSSSVPLGNEPNRRSVAQQPHSGVPLSRSQMPQEALFPQHGAGAFKATAQRNASQSSGLNFAPAVAYGSGGTDADSVVVADVNGDGKPDLVVAGDGGVVGVLLGNGDGTFQTAITYGSGGCCATSVAVADVNGDGKPDLVVANQAPSNGNFNDGGVVAVLLGNGDGTFQAAVDLTGDFCTRWNERKSTWRKSWSCPSRDTSQSKS